MGIKIGDSNPQMTKGSRADKYWTKNQWAPLYKKVRPGFELPKSLQTNDADLLVKKFNLKGIGFGNWVNIEDRKNYLYSTTYAMYDLNKVLRFNFNLGMGLLGITYGARGVGRALAHYEPGTDIINITRYQREGGAKAVRFFGTGGLGSLSHEYGHFLDYFAGAYLAPNASIYSLTDGRSIAKARTNAKNELREAMDNLMEAIIWKRPGEIESPYYKRLLATIENTSKGEYWIRRNEIFARAFEVYVQQELKRSNITNRLLTSTKYATSVYLKPSEMATLKPKFDKVISLIREKIK